MTKVVLGIGTSHSPMLSTTPDQWPKHVERDLVNSQLWAWDGKPHKYEELVEMADPSVKNELGMDKWWERYNACQAAIEKVGEIIADVSPDILVIVGDDQKEVLHEDNMPSMMVYWGDTVLNKPRDRSRMPESIALAAWANEFDEPREFPAAGDLGLHIIKSLVHEEFDVAHSKVLPNGHGEGHAFGFVHRRILHGRPVPIVPIMQNTYYPPNQPTPQRSYKLGQAVRRAIDSWESDARVAVVASGGLTHFVVDEKLDRGVLKALEQKDAEHLKSIPEELLNSGNSEIRNWIATAGAVVDLDMKLIDYVPCYRSPASTGCAMAFAYWD
jgi:hypothetical protein